MKRLPLIICFALLGSLANAQEIYRAVTDRGKVVYSDDAGVPAGDRLKEVKVYSQAGLRDGNRIQRPAGMPLSQNQACQSDVLKYCGRPSADQTECLLDHQQDISDLCYDALKRGLSSGAAKPTESQGNQACQADVEKLCRGVQPGGGRISDCLLDNQKSLSDACYDALERRLSKRR